MKFPIKEMEVVASHILGQIGPDFKWEVNTTDKILAVYNKVNCWIGIEKAGLGRFMYDVQISIADAEDPFVYRDYNLQTAMSGALLKAQNYAYGVTKQVVMAETALFPQRIT